MVGCDLHDESMLLRMAFNQEAARTKTYGTDRESRQKMIGELKNQAVERQAPVVFAYEASAQGYGLYDDLKAVGVECYVLAPTRMVSTAKQRKSKCDEKDAHKILEIVRGHKLAGNDLPAVWVPDGATRDERELLRARMDVADKAVSVRAQVRMLLKRQTVEIPKEVGKKWTERFEQWLQGLEDEGSPLGPGARACLQSLRRQLALAEAEIQQLDGQVAELARQPRYAAAVRELVTLKGVGVWTAMVFLTEMGDLQRFSNRREIGAYLGLVPSSDDTGLTDRKGHITRQGSPRVRKALCQATWSRVRFDPGEQQWYQQVVQRNPKHKKIAIVGSMRRLAIVMWHRALAAQADTPPPPAPQRGERQLASAPLLQHTTRAPSTRTSPASR